jgi:hypothetical protein
VVAGIEETSPATVADVLDDYVATLKLWLDCLCQGEKRDEEELEASFVRLEVVGSTGARR